jgi:hypothetical protein
MVDNPGYLQQLVAYVHLNPVAAGLVRDPAKYEWSGHREIVREIPDSLLDTEQVLSMFGKTKAAARSAYVRALRSAREQKWVGEVPGKLPWWKLGRPKRSGEEELHPELPRTFVDELGRSSGLERRRLTVEEFVQLACKHLEIDIEALRGRTRARHVVRARELVVTLGAERWDLTVKGLAKTIGKGVQAGSEYISRGIRRRCEDREFRDRLERLDQEVARSSSR